MLKFARQQRSSSVERNQHQSRQQSPSCCKQFQRTNTREFSPARQLQRACPKCPRCPNQTCNGSTPRLPRSRTASLERNKTRRQLTFDDMRSDCGGCGFVSPRDISANRQSNSPPMARTTKLPIQVAKKKAISPESSNPTIPMTPTLEKLSSPHVTHGIKPLPLLRSVLKYPNKYDFHRAVEKLVEKLDLQLLDTSSESGYGSDHDSLGSNSSQAKKEGSEVPPPLPRRLMSGKKKVHFDSYVLLLQGLREHNLEMVQRHVKEVCPEALQTDEVLTDMMKSVIEGNELILRELLIHGCNANYTDPSGLTPLHLAATFNNLPMVKILIESGAAIFARAHSSGKLPSEMCSPRLVLPNSSHAYQACLAYLRCMEECLGVANGGVVFVARPYRNSCRNDELCVRVGERLGVVRKGDYPDSCWWWCRKETGEEGYVLRDLLAIKRPKISA